MRAFVLPFSVLALTLSACASTPKADTLMSGIDQSQMKSVAPSSSSASTAELRDPTDPVCARFYANAQNYIRAANTPSGGSRFLTSVGVSVLAGVVGGGVGSGIGSQVGRYAVQSAATQAIYQGSDIALRELSKNSKADAQVIESAAQIGCPVAVSAS